jgi:hypothetical protein
MLNRREFEDQISGVEVIDATSSVVGYLNLAVEY